MNLRRIFKKIYSLKISDVLVEAGGIFFTNLLKNRLVDEIHIFQSKIIIGQNGKPAILGKKMDDLKIYLKETKKFKSDTYFKYNLI